MKDNISHSQWVYKIWSLQIKPFQRYFRRTKNKKMGHVLSSIGWDLLWSTCLSNPKSQRSPMKIWKAMQNIEIGWLGVVQDHWQCYHLIQCIQLPIWLQQKLCIHLVLFLSYASYFVKSRLFLTYPPAFCVLFGADPILFSPWSLASEN